MNQLGDGGVADKQVVVAAFQSSATHGESGRLPAEERGDLEHLGVVALGRQVIRRRQSCHATANDPDSH